MGINQLSYCLLLSTLFAATSPMAQANETKLGCREVEAIQAKCLEYETLSKSCDSLVQTESKAKVDAAKQEQEACKTKHSYAYLAKCKNEMKKATTLVNTPKQVLHASTKKDLVAKSDTPCASAEVIGNEQKLCRGPKKIIETMKANCIKDL